MKQWLEITFVYRGIGERCYIRRPVLDGPLVLVIAGGHKGLVNAFDGHLTAENTR